MSQEQPSQGERQDCQWHVDKEAATSAEKGGKHGKVPGKFKFAAPQGVEKFKARDYLEKEVKYISYENLRRDKD